MPDFAGRSMGITDYQAKYIAWELTLRRSAGSNDKLAAAVAGALVDLNPHQVDAALFAFKSPLSKGVLLADEVGLGKTIEAGLVMSQRWAELHRRILVITPSNLRKQWHQELSEKFFLPCLILESRSYNALAGNAENPFVQKDRVVICSYQFARSKAAELRDVPWDLVVIDEAHRLRNVYKPSNIIANALKTALAGANKLLLTATPLQNSPLELFGLISFIDDHVFGDLDSFRERFTSASTQPGAYEALKTRLRPICQRTLRRQVVAYIPYTKRHPLVQDFTPEESEQQLYELVSEYLRRENLQALPASQRSLITLVLRKLLASSSFAIEGALRAMAERLRKRLSRFDIPPVVDELTNDYEALPEAAEEWEEDDQPLATEDRAAMEKEAAELERYADLAASIQHNAKGKALLAALDIAFRRAAELGAARKAIIFTESRRTQNYLLRLLDASPYAGGVVLFNGSNTDPKSRATYDAWLARHDGTDRITGSRTADMRSAIVDEFRERGQIMIATEAGAEGINLQFCSLVVNYDLPWNPQRIEQRIGRCHRYGQKHDVVVVNFVNRKNEADKRVFELLSQKFQLFDGVFGASDDVLGAIESGVDFEKRVADIYQRCRRPDEIAAAFDALQLELSLEIHESLTRTRRQLLEHFDDEVREKLRIRDRDAREALGRTERQLMTLTRHVLANRADFLTESSFALKVSPRPDVIPLGVYELPRRTGDAHLFRPGHPLAEYVLREATSRELSFAEIEFNYTAHEGRISALKELLGAQGWLSISVLSIESLDQVEDHLIHVGFTDSGVPLDADTIQRLLSVPGKVALPNLVEEPPSELEAGTFAQREDIQSRIAYRNARLLEAEAEKLDGWAEDLKLALEHELKDLDRQIREARRATLAMTTLQDKLDGQKQVKALEAQRNQKRRTLFEAQDQIDAKRQALIEQIEGKLPQRATLTKLFAIRWRLC